ncbi:MULTISPECIES: PaaI family thioesterase [unclassified Mycobacterium]|uniref:PaaI family thioesterase n=1 Tax=unclassified Mycobacterium TaxID=2642494 RepID=UPI00114D4234|nr:MULTISPECIES: PaaI family thioesterase [unclassified Mycobacterium]
MDPTRSRICSSASRPASDRSFDGEQDDSDELDTGPARAEARIVHRGRRSAVVQIEIRRGNGDLAATATVNFAALEGRP